MSDTIKFESGAVFNKSQLQDELKRNGCSPDSNVPHVRYIDHRNSHVIIETAQEYMKYGGAQNKAGELNILIPSEIK